MRLLLYLIYVATTSHTYCIFKSTIARTIDGLRRTSGCRRSSQARRARRPQCVEEANNSIRRAEHPGRTHPREGRAAERASANNIIPSLLSHCKSCRGMLVMLMPRDKNVAFRLAAAAAKQANRLRAAPHDWRNSNCILRQLNAP